MDKYWDLTLLEINDILEAYNRRKTKEKKARVDELFVLAGATANRIAVSFSKDAGESDVTMPWDYYPDLFENRSEELEKQRELAETEAIKLMMEGRVAAWNRRFEEEHKDDG